MSGVKFQFEISDRTMERILHHDEIMKGKAVPSAAYRREEIRPAPNMAPNKPAIDTSYLEMLSKVVIPVLTGEPDLASWLSKKAVDYVMGGYFNPYSPPYKTNCHPLSDDILRRMGRGSMGCTEEERMAVENAGCTGPSDKSEPERPTRPPYPEDEGEDVVGTSVSSNDLATLMAMQACFRVLFPTESDVVSEWLAKLVCGKLENVPTNISQYFSLMTAMNGRMMEEPSDEFAQEIDNWIKSLQKDDSIPQEVKDFLASSKINRFISPSATVNSMNDDANCEKPQSHVEAVERSGNIPTPPPMPGDKSSRDDKTNEMIESLIDGMKALASGEANTGEFATKIAKLAGIDLRIITPGQECNNADPETDGAVAVAPESESPPRNDCTDMVCEIPVPADISDDLSSSPVVIEDCPSDE